MSTARSYRVSGRVQGVGFRWWVRTTAKRLGLVGSVRNEADGSVLVAAWGAEDALARLEDLLSVGPPGARVDAVEPLGEPTAPPPRDFSIER